MGVCVEEPGGARSDRGKLEGVSDFESSCCLGLYASFWGQPRVDDLYKKLANSQTL